MKITAINIGAYQRLTNLELQVSAPILMIAGANEMGKSSMEDAIRHAILGTPGRGMSGKKDLPNLVHDGKEQGHSVVEWDGGQEDGGGSCSVILPSGELNATAPLPRKALLPFLLNAHAFAQADASTRRSVLFDVAGVKMSGKAILQRLTEEPPEGMKWKARKCDAAKSTEIAPLLLSGFEAATTRAKKNASEARGGWKATAGENYGSLKAKTWTAPKPEFDASAKISAQSTCADLIEQIEAQNQAIGELSARTRTASEQVRQQNDLREKAGKLERAKAKLEVDEATLAEWTAKVAETKAKAEGAPPVTPHPCPHCAGLLVIAGGRLEAYEAPTTTRDPDAVAKLPEYERALKLAESSVTNDKRDIAAAEAAEAALANLQLVTAPTEVETAAAKAELERLKEELKAASATMRALEATEQAHAQADKKTADAARYHQDVEQWEAIEDALSPGGIPSDLLTEAMGPITARLAHTSAVTGWDPVTIDADMTIRVGGRLHALGSVSAKWRADAAITEALAYVSGVRMFMVDEFDVLLGDVRMAGLKWLAHLAKTGDVDTVVVAGSFKEPPQCPRSFQVVWIQDGRDQAQLQAAA